MKVKEINDICIFQFPDGIFQLEMYDYIEILSDLIGNGKKKFILDLENQSRISSSTISAFVHIKRKISAASGEISIAANNKTLLQIFEITMVDKLIPIYKNIDEALKSFHFG